MEIFIEDIPDGGLHLEGDFPESIFELPENDTIRPKGDVHYKIDVYSMEEMLAFVGSLSGAFQLQCGTCLEYFDFDANFPTWSSELDLAPKQKSFNLKEIIREDFLLELPSHPRCDEWVEDRVCPKADFLTDDPGSGEELGEDEAPQESKDVWGALDEFKE